MNEKSESRIRVLIAGTGATGAAADEMFRIIDDVIWDERQERYYDGYYDGQQAAACDRPHSDY